MWNRLTHHGGPANNKAPLLPSRKQSNIVPRVTNGTTSNESAGRPYLGDTRGSTISLLSNSSDVSLIGNGVRPRTESNLRHTLNSSPPPDVPDPVLVLSEIIRSNAGEETPMVRRAFDEVSDVNRDDIDTFIKFGESSLEDYINDSRGDEPRLTASRSFGLPAGSSEQLQHDHEQFENLHRSIAECDAVLKTVEAHLMRFQTDLGLVSTEIEALQTRSTLLTAKLENRKNVEKVLGPAVEEISISPLIVKKISEGEIDEYWADALREVERWSKTVLDKPKDQRAKATEDMQALAVNLLDRAVERIREHLIKQIKSFRQPMANAQLIQQHTMLKTSCLYGFLSQKNRRSADEIGQAYGNGMRWYYSHNFERYHRALEKLNIHQTDKFDLVGEEDAPKRRKDTPLHPMKSSSHFFALQRRSDIITAVNPATPAFLASSDTSQAVYLESPFRSVNLAILDNACSEYSFLTSYFSGSSFSSLSTRFAQIFGPTFALGQNFTSSLVGQSTDCLGILLCVRLNEQFALESQRRKIPVLEPYINENARLLWPRFQKAIDAHCDSLRHAASVSSLTTRNLSNTLSSLAGAASTPSLAPHFLTQRFAQFIHGILNLTKERVNKTSGLPIVVGDSPKSAGSHRSDVLLSPGLSSDEEPIGRSLLRLRSEFENVMNRLSKEIGDQRKIDRFLSNNYGLIGTILGDVPGVMADEMRAWLSERGGDREIS